ncbi:hypothetical protein HCC61_16885 [Streptomyces sp. HNM0575]|uniref:hypothetical protein n=1 Tax=Streptomyces sp. HNM0575 TaxID=2716338 RepID=UPI00145DB325|nr:hypothetical protein [Streptomyces sp. HNM0575]NLU74333.1 hypothetical protein [Streptomyces sp. HNM0575]
MAGTRFCSACALRLTRDLTRLPRLYDECGMLLGGSDGRLRERTSGGGSLPGIPFNTAAAEARSMILGVLRSWAGLVAAERVVAGPGDTVAGVVEFLVRHAGWLAAHEAAGELSEEVARAVRRARYVVDPPSGRGMGVGTCVEAGCEGELTAVVRIDRADAPVEIACAAAPSHRWSAQQWMGLTRGTSAGRQVRPEGPVRAEGPALRAPAVRWLSARDISLLWGVASGSVYRHASEQRWRRRSAKGRTFYHQEDVLRSLGARTGGRS